MRPRSWMAGIAILALGASLLSAQSSLPYSVLTTSLPAGDVGIPYGQPTLDASVGYEQPNQWTIIAGQLPPGLSLSNPTGDGSPDLYVTIISGTPTTPGLFNFTVQASQAGQPPLSATQALSIQINGPITITTTSLPGGVIGVAYTQQLASSGGPGGGFVTWTPISGTLPPGLSMSSDGILSGTPTAIGSYSFVVEVDDYYGDGGLETATQSFTVNIAGPRVPVMITTGSNLSAGTVGVPYSQQIAATGGAPPYKWSVASGALPGGLSLNAASGLISGTPTTTGSFSFELSASDQFSDTATNSFTLSVATPLSIATPSPLPGGTTGASYTATLSAAGGTPPYTWSTQSGTLPPGLSLDSAGGRLTGTPTATGSYQFTAAVKDAAARTATKPMALVIASAFAVTSTSPLPGGAVGTAYQQQFTATGGTPPYAWSAQSGSVPPGLVLDATTGRLTGTPTTSGNYQFVAGVADAAGLTASKLMTLNIETLLVITTTSPLVGGTIGSAYQQAFAATGGTPPYTWSLSASALPAGLTFDPASGALSGTPTAGGPFSVTVTVRDALQSVAKAFGLTIGAPALPPVTITGLPGTGSPATQPTVAFSLATPYTLDLTGTATMTFAPDSGSDDPAVQFTAGGRSVGFQIPAGTTLAVFGGSSLGVQTGTVAGTITITLRLLAAGADVTPAPTPTVVLRIPPAPPVIVSAKLVSNSTGFDLLITGYSTTREVTGAAVHLAPAAGAKLAGTDFTIALTSVFATWYQDPASVPFGSQFSLDIPFTVQNATSAIGSLTVTLTNSQGTSPAANAAF